MSVRKTFTHSLVASIVVALLAAGFSQPASAGWYQGRTVEVWDTTGLNEIPQEFYDSGLQQVKTVYMREFYLPAPSPDRYIPPNDWTMPEVEGIRRAAAQYADESVVIFDIEAEVARHPELVVWDVTNPATIEGAIWRYRVVIETWRQENPDQKVCLYGFPRGSLVSAVRNKEDVSYIYDQARMQKPITDMADCLTPAAYWGLDDPEAQLGNWKIKAEICREIYNKPCYFLINPFDKSRDWEPHQNLTIRYSLRELNRLDGVTGIALWTPSALRTAEYNQRLINWRNLGGYYNHRDVQWLRELNSFLGNPFDL